MNEQYIADAKLKCPQAFKTRKDVLAVKAVIAVVFSVLTLWCLIVFDFSPMRLWIGVTKLWDILGFMFPPTIWQEYWIWEEVLIALGETVAMAFIGTLLGAVIAFPLAFLGAKNIYNGWMRHFCRRGFDAMRAVEVLILALIFIRAFGLGPLAGVLAIAVSEIGVLAKLYSEAIENVSNRSVDGVKASGGSHMQNVRYGVIPQVLPVILSITLYNFESNTRSSTILGIVGAGGIGFLLSDRIAAFLWGDVWTMIILIVLTVYLIDYISAKLRSALIKG